MAIIIDADVIIRGEKGVFDLKNWLAMNASERFEIAAITVAELWHGVERAVGARRLRRQNYLESVISHLPVISYSEEIAYEHARIWAQLETAGTMIGYYDLIVAATALTRGSDVASYNQKHFSMVAGLKVIEPKP
jgi:tRNA(fMet)-specific endonuclease VapC